MALRERDVLARRLDDGALEVQAPRVEVGDLAHELGLAVHELADVGQSLEDAFVELTGSSVEFHGGTQPRAAAAAEVAR